MTNKKITAKKSSKKITRKPRGLTATHSRNQLILSVLVIIFLALVSGLYYYLNQSQGIGGFRAQPLLKIQAQAKKISPKVVAGIKPAFIKSVYNLPTGNVGTGTIAIIDAYDNPKLESDLAFFSKQFGLPPCTKKNGCLSIVKMRKNIRSNVGWGLEEALDVQWAHAIAPGAKILLVEAASDGGRDLLNAVSYAAHRPDVVAISMSWGGNEFATESNYESYFTSPYGAKFFAASGDSGHGTMWPAVSSNVISVGGTTIKLDSSGKLVSETAWRGSGGGVSSYMNEPGYQISYGIANTSGKRSVPDVSYNADPSSGFSVYDTFGYGGWMVVGGTSAGSPQWAAIHAIGKSVSSTQLYADGGSTAYDSYFRDIKTGTNGTCGLFCQTQSGYDTVTGLGSPLTQQF